MKIYVHHNCSSCKKALKWLAENNIQAEVINLLEETPSKEEFQIMVNSYNGNHKKLFNTSGQLYREMKMKELLPSMSQDDIYELLGREGMLVKRPFLIISQDKGLVGFKEKEWKDLA